MEKCRIQPKCFPSPPRHGQFTSKKDQKQTNGNNMCYPVDQKKQPYTGLKTSHSRAMS